MGLVGVSLLLSFVSVGQAEEMPKLDMADTSKVKQVLGLDAVGTIVIGEESETDDLPAIKIGTVPHGATSSAPLLIQNRGTEPLRFDSVETTCGCVVATLLEKEVQPQGEIPALLAIIPTESGPLRQRLRLKFRSGEREREITFPVVGTARSWIKIGRSRFEYDPDDTKSITTTFASDFGHEILADAKLTVAGRGFSVVGDDVILGSSRRLEIAVDPVSWEKGEVTKTVLVNAVPGTKELKSSKFMHDFQPFALSLQLDNATGLQVKPSTVHLRIGDDRVRFRQILHANSTLLDDVENGKVIPFLRRGNNSIGAVQKVEYRRLSPEYLSVKLAVPRDVFRKLKSKHAKVSWESNNREYGSGNVVVSPSPLGESGNLR